MKVGGLWRVLLVLVLIGAACSGGGDEDAARDEREAGEEQEGGQSSADAEAVAEEWLDDWQRLDEPTRASLQATRTVASRGVTHVHFGQEFDGVAVRGAEVVVHVLDDGTVQGATDSLVDARPPGDAEAEVDEEAAREIAGKAVPGEVSETKSARQVWLPDGDTLRLGWSVLMSTDERRGAWTIWVDAVTGEVADAKQVTTNRGGRRAQSAGGCDLDDEDEPAACVFLPDPIYASGGEIDDADDADEANEFLAAQPLLGLDDPGSGALVGEFVNAEPEVAPLEPVRDPDGRWDIGRGEEGFEAVMSYFWVDRAQRLFQELGFDDVRNESFGIVPVDPETVDNAFYTPAEQVVVMGVGSDGVNEGEDASGILHEYGHAVLDAQVPNMLLNEQGRAYHEAFGDLVAFFVSLEFRQGDAECLFAWAEAGECLRRVDTDKVIPDDLVQEEHLDGEIFTGAVYDVFEALLDGEGLTVADCTDGEENDTCLELRDRMVATLLGANEFLTPAATLADAALAFRLANEAGFDGADAALLDEAFEAHGFDEGSEAIVGPDGEPTVEAPEASVAIDISHDFRGDLRVLVGVADADFEDLCEAIAVLEPDGDDAGDNVVGRIDVSDTDCAEFLPPGPDQQWILFVEDTEPEDEGVINSFRVFDGETPFLATGVPRPIADDDPTGSAVIVNGSGRAVAQEGTEEVGGEGEAAGGPAVAVAIEHPFVGDLFIRVGVADANGSVLCSIPVQDPDPTDDSADLAGTVAAGECAELFPPAPDRQWFLEVIDTAEEDAGAIVEFQVLDAGGEVVAEAAGLPVDIPDNDRGGATVAVG